MRRICICIVRTAWLDETLRAPAEDVALPSVLVPVSVDKGALDLVCVEVSVCCLKGGGEPGSEDGLLSVEVDRATLALACVVA